MAVPPYPAGPDRNAAGRRLTFTVSPAAGCAYRMFWVDGTGRIDPTAWTGLRLSNRVPNRFSAQRAPAS